jgi:hypothetical protein
MAFPDAANNFIPSAPVPAPIPALSALDAARAAVTAVEARRKALLAEESASERDLDKVDRDLALTRRGLEKAEHHAHDSLRHECAARSAQAEENYARLIPGFAEASERFTASFKTLIAAHAEMTQLANEIRAKTHNNISSELPGFNPDLIRPEMLTHWLRDFETGQRARAAHRPEMFAALFEHDERQRVEAVTRQRAHRVACGMPAEFV